MDCFGATRGGMFWEASGKKRCLSHCCLTLLVSPADVNEKVCLERAKNLSEV